MMMDGDVELFVCLNGCITSKVTFFFSLTVTLGQTVGQQQAGNQFKGELSKVNIHRSVSLDTVLTSSTLSPDISGLETGVYVNG